VWRALQVVSDRMLFIREHVEGRRSLTARRSVLLLAIVLNLLGKSSLFLLTQVEIDLTAMLTLYT
jgi:hypothetical protein